MGGDSSAVMTPIFRIGRLIGTASAIKHEDLHAGRIRRLSCNPKGFWKAWQEDVLRFKHDWRTSTKELVLHVNAKCGNDTFNVRILVDTGAKIPLVFQRGLIPSTSLRKAAFPVKFTTVDGQAMEGGTYGTFLEFRLPIWRQERLITARTCSLFAYEANVQGVDIIMGYPFLKAFNLQVDSANDRLVLESIDSSRVQEKPLD